MKRRLVNQVEKQSSSSVHTWSHIREVNDIIIHCVSTNVVFENAY